VPGGQTHSVKRHLDVDAHGYDVQIRRFIPYYDDMLATGVELLGALAPASGHVLDLGGGWRAVSRRPSEKHSSRLRAPPAWLLCSSNGRTVDDLADASDQVSSPRSAPAPSARTGSGDRLPLPVRSCPSSSKALWRASCDRVSTDPRRLLLAWECGYGAVAPARAT
jgi:hypothetical protein